MNLDDRKLLLLGLLRIQEMHGYQLNQFLEEHLDFLPQLKPPTAYYTLERMAEQGWVKAHSEQAGNRPTRQIYEITAAGEAKFQQLLRRNLAHYDVGESADDIGFAFLSELPAGEVHTLLATKRASIRQAIADIQEAAQRVNESSSVHLSIAHSLRRLQGDLEWLDEVEAWLERRRETVGSPGAADPSTGTP